MTLKYDCSTCKKRNEGMNEFSGKLVKIRFRFIEQNVVKSSHSIHTTELDLIWRNFRSHSIYMSNPLLTTVIKFCFLQQSYSGTNKYIIIIILFVGKKNREVQTDERTCQNISTHTKFCLLFIKTSTLQVYLLINNKSE